MGVFVIKLTAWIMTINIVRCQDWPHLLDEPGTLEEVARLATLWFSQHLGKVLAKNAE